MNNTNTKTVERREPQAHHVVILSDGSVHLGPEKVTDPKMTRSYASGRYLLEDLRRLSAIEDLLEEWSEGKDRSKREAAEEIYETIKEQGHA